MNPHCTLFAGCAIFASLFSVQGASAQETNGLSESGWSDPLGARRPLFTLQKDNLKKELQRNGILQYSRNAKFRIGIPLASFGDDGPKLMFTYAPRMPGGQQRKVFMIYLQMDLE